MTAKENYKANSAWTRLITQTIKIKWNENAYGTFKRIELRVTFGIVEYYL